MSKSNSSKPAAATKGGAGAPPAAETRTPVQQSGGADKTVIVPALSVVSSRDGFRRGGRAWGKEATVVKLADLDKQQIAQIKGEALLTVTEVEIVDEGPAAEL